MRGLWFYFGISYPEVAEFPWWQAVGIFPDKCAYRQCQSNLYLMCIRYYDSPERYSRGSIRHFLIPTPSNLLIKATNMVSYHSRKNSKCQSSKSQDSFYNHLQVCGVLLSQYLVLIIQQVLKT